MTFSITFLLEFHDSLGHTWLLVFHLFFFTMITIIHHEFHIIMWWEHDMSLSLRLWLIVTDDMDFLQWWHGCHLYIRSSSSFDRWCIYPPKGLWSNRVFKWFLSSIFKCVLRSFHASFVCSLCLIFLMCDFHNVYKIPVSTITHGKQISASKYLILPCFMHILCWCLFSSLKRDKRSFWVHGKTLKG